MMIKRIKLLLACLLLTSLFSPPAESAAQKSIVTVVEGKAMCFEVPEGLPAGKLRSGIFIEKINEYSSKVELAGGREGIAYIPYDLRYEIHDKLQPGAVVLLQRNYRRIYQTQWDIISVGYVVTGGLAYSEGETQGVSDKVVNDLIALADEVKEGIGEEESQIAEEARGEVVQEVTVGVVGVSEAGLVSAGDQTEESQGSGAGPVVDAEAAEAAADTVTSSPLEPTPPTESKEYYYVDPVNGDNGNDGSEDSPWKTITYALARADSGVSTTIYLASGTYNTSSGESFPLSMRNGFTLDGAGAGSSIIDGTSGGSSGIIYCYGITGATIRDISVRNGTGGGITILGSTVTINECTISNNTNTYPGGGIYSAGSSTITLNSCTISNNTTTTHGGGIGSGSDTITLNSCTISSNTSSINGGGMWTSGATVTINNSTFSGNTANSDSGGGFKWDSLSGPTGAGTLSISNSTFSNNNSGAYGGGIDLSNSNQTATIENTTITNNTATTSDGGGGINISNQMGSATIRGCTIKSNTGCGIRRDSGATVPTIRNSSFYNNKWSAGGAEPRYEHYYDGTTYRDAGTTTYDPGLYTSINEDMPGGIPGDSGNQELSGDPPITGRVYDSVTEETIPSPTIAIYQAGTTTALSTTTANPYTFNVDPGNYYIAVTKDGYGFPSQIIAEAVDGDHGDIFTAVNDPLTINIPMDPDGWLYIEKTANKKKVSIGEIITYNIKIQNKNWYKAVDSVELIDELVNGFKYVDNSSTSHQPLAISNHKVVFNLGTVSANSTTNISYQVRVGMGIPEGRYESAANTRKSTTGLRNSNISSVNIEVIEDPLFTKGTIIGKVFYDINGNGIQDTTENPNSKIQNPNKSQIQNSKFQTEAGIPGVKIYTEYGVCVETDQDGKYHIKDVPAGNHLLKVDPQSVILSGCEALDSVASLTISSGIASSSSTPRNDSCRFTTDNPYFVKMTEGLLAKVNFGVTQANPQTRKPADQFFIVALGEGIVRNLDTSGNIDMVEKDDTYDDGVQVDGRLALFLKGKVLGKYLITASLDTDRLTGKPADRRTLFTNLDPDKYYPVYGDASTVDYSGVDTQDVIYIMIEWDESFARWGSFHTELPVYNRTLSGGIINYKSTGKTEFGDIRTEIKGFGAFSRQKPAHDEFVGTGGSLYYLRHDNIIEGSEKLKVETRDRIGKTTISSIPLLEEKDYEIDYDTGRILLKRPLNSIQQGYTGSIISNDILMGERVYLVVDYEYYSESLSNESYGGRASQWVGDHIRVGGTYVQENKQDTDDYQIYGLDTTLKLNKDTEITANYSHSEETQLNSNLSYDGGLSFQEQYDTFSQGQDGDAYSVGGKTKLFNNTDIQLVYTKQDPYYSASDSISQQGSEKYIAAIASKLTPNLTAGISHITQKYKEEVTVTRTFGEREVNTTTAILDYQKNKWDIRGEYQHQESKNPVTTYTYFGTIPLLDNDFIAARIGYQLFDWLHPYIRGQGTLQGEVNNQGTVGADITIYKNTALNLAETVGTQGNSTLVGLTSKITEDTDVYANLEVGNHINLGKFTKTIYGQSSLLGPGSKAYIEQDYSSYRENIVRGNLLGYDKKITDTLALGLTYERSNVENNTTVIDRDTGSISLAYLNPDWLKLNTKLEVRNDLGTTEIRQWVTENDILWSITESITLSGRGNWGWTEDIDNEEDEAEFYEVGAGFSLRPVTWDRLNLLGKYSYISNLPPDSQLSFIELTESRRHVYAIEGAYDLFRYLQLVGKFAYRDLDEKVGPRDWTESDTYLYIARSNFHIMNAEQNKPFILRGWDLGVEYRILTNDQIEDEKDGFLVELDKDIGDYLRMGVGYNFTDYDDDLRDEDNWDAKGWFVRVNGKY